MKTALYALGILALTFAGYVFFLCGLQWYQNFTQANEKPALSVVEKFLQVSISSENSSRQNLTPLDQQAVVL